jgi:GPH family glycoside/pentoside/hexuronide:cation symporter
VIPYGALTAALTQDLPAEDGDPSPGYTERTRLNGARMAWSMVGGIVSGVAMPLLFNTYSWRTAGLVLGLCIAPPLWVAVAATKGRDPNGSSGAGPGMWSVLGNGPYRRVVAQFCASWTVVATLSSIVPFYVEHHLHRTDLLDALFAAIQLSALVCIPGIVWLSGRWDKPRAYGLAMASWAAVLLGLALVPEGNAPAAIAMACLVGPGVAAAHVLPWAMLPDVVAADRATTGVDRSGQFYGMMTFLEKVVLAAALWGVGTVLGVSGYLEGATHQPESARLAVLALIGPIPGVVLASAAIAAWRWPKPAAAPAG